MDTIRLVKEEFHRGKSVEQLHRRFGLKLFGVYLCVYAGFIGTAAFNHAVFSERAIFGLNVAVLYGFGLIGLAFALALIFLMSGKKTNGTNAPNQRSQ
jgi:uncharacterized membrane protein (DUF485 family)